LLSVEQRSASFILASYMSVWVLMAAGVTSEMFAGVFSYADCCCWPNEETFSAGYSLYTCICCCSLSLGAEAGPTSGSTIMGGALCKCDDMMLGRWTTVV